MSGSPKFQHFLAAIASAAAVLSTATLPEKIRILAALVVTVLAAYGIRPPTPKV